MMKNNLVHICTMLSISLLMCTYAIAEPATKADIALKANTAPQAMTESFKARGQSKLDRLLQDNAMAACSEYANKLIPAKIAARITAQNLQAIPFPKDGQYLGDWKAGERIAQSGVGKQFSDNPDNPSGGNCYACHQLSPQELSYGTIGASLSQYGEQHGYSNEIAKYAYGKIFNLQAYLACATMSRFGHNHILTDTQIKDLVALLMDPASPVNK